MMATRGFKSCALYFAHKHRSGYTRNCFLAYIGHVVEKYREQNAHPR